MLLPSSQLLNCDVDVRLCAAWLVLGCRLRALSHPFVCLRWFDSVDELVDSACSPLAWFDFTLPKMSSEPKSVDHEPRESCRPFIAHMVFVGREFVFLLDAAPYSKLDSQNLHLLITAAIIWAIHKTKIIEQNGTFESTSRQRLENSVLPYVVQRSRAALSQHWRKQEHIWSAYHNILTLNNVQCYRLLSFNSAQYLLRLGRIKAGSCSYHEKFVCTRTEATSSRRSRSACFDQHLSSIAVFTPAQTKRTNEETAPEFILTRPNSFGVESPSVTYPWGDKSHKLPPMTSSPLLQNIVRATAKTFPSNTHVASKAGKSRFFCHFCATWPFKHYSVIFTIKSIKYLLFTAS